MAEVQRIDSPPSHDIRLRAAPATLGSPFRRLPSLEHEIPSPFPHEAFDSPHLRPRPLTVVRDSPHPDFSVPLQCQPARPICRFNQRDARVAVHQRSLEVLYEDKGVGGCLSRKEEENSSSVLMRPSTKLPIRKEKSMKKPGPELRNSSVPIPLKEETPVKPIFSLDHSHFPPHITNLPSIFHASDSISPKPLFSPVSPASLVAHSPNSSFSGNTLPQHDDVPDDKQPNRKCHIKHEKKEKTEKRDRKIISSSGEVMDFSHRVNVVSPSNNPPLKQNTLLLNPVTPEHQYPSSHRKSSKRKMNLIESQCTNLVPLFISTCHETEKERPSPFLKDSKPKVEDTSHIGKVKVESKESTEQDCPRVISSFVTRSMRKWDNVEVSLFLSEIGMSQYQKVRE